MTFRTASITKLFSMKIEQEVYKQVEVFEKESEDSFLLLYQNRTLSVGFLVKDIFLLMQNGILDIEEIKENIFNKHNLVVDVGDIERVADLLNNFIFGKIDLHFLKFGKLINPESIGFSLNFLFNKFLFYCSFAAFFVLNILIFVLLPSSRLDGILDWIMWILLLLGAIFFHELGHSFSARKYGINCKEIGIGLYGIFPVLYTNLGESWRLRKDKRIIINLSGIYFQLMLGVIIGALAWFTGSNILSLLFFSNFVIALLNLNPFIKFDGYWVVTDLLNTNHLSKAANNELIRFFSFKYKDKNVKLLVYAFLRLIFIALIIFIVFILSISLIKKIFHPAPLSYHEYLLIVFILFYLLKYIRNEHSKRKAKVFK